MQRTQTTYTQRIRNADTQPRTHTAEKKFSSDRSVCTGNFIYFFPAFFFSFNAENDVEFRCLHIEKRANNKRCFFHVNYIVPSKIHPQKESKLLKAEISQFYIAELIGIKGRLINSLFCRKITWLYLECLSRICCNAM